MIIDCHGHYTTGPAELGEYREQQKRELASDPQFEHQKGQLNISDDQLRESLENNQLKLQRERGTDLTIFSPRALLNFTPKTLLEVANYRKPKAHPSIMPSLN